LLETSLVDCATDSRNSVSLDNYGVNCLAAVV